MSAGMHILTRTRRAEPFSAFEDLWDKYKRDHKSTDPKRASKVDANPLSLVSFKLGVGNRYLKENSIVKQNETKITAVTKAFGEISLREKKMKATVSILGKSDSEFLRIVVTKYSLYESPISVTVNAAFWQRNPGTLKLICAMWLGWGALVGKVIEVSIAGGHAPTGSILKLVRGARLPSFCSCTIGQVLALHAY